MLQINRLEIENLKRIKAVIIEPTKTGLTVIGGKNNQGKTSILDAIAWGLGGNTFKPSNPQRDGSVIPPRLNITLSNGMVVKRDGKNSSLKVIDPAGNKGGQQLLNEFVEQLALDLPKFMHSNNKEKANTLLQIIGVGEQLYELEQQEQEVYNQRHAIGQIADQKKKFAAEMEYHPDAPKELISVSELIQQQQEILTRNGENQRKRDNLANLEAQSERLQQQINELTEKLKVVTADLEIARKSALDLLDESTEELESNIHNIEQINIMVRTNQDKARAEQDANEYGNQYTELTAKLEGVRRAKTSLLESADLPLPGLSVMDGELVYNGQKWDGISGSDQLKIAVAIVRKLKPKCGFVLLDKLEQMDLDTLQQFGKWLEGEGLQAIATRVSTGDECSIVIEDGYIAGDAAVIEEIPAFEEGVF